MLIIRCKNCNTELTSNSQARICGCSNMTMIRNDIISAQNLSLVELISGIPKRKTQTEYQHLTKEDLVWMEDRKSRNIRKLDFEIR